MNFHVREDAEINTSTPMNGAIHCRQGVGGERLGSEDLPDFMKALRYSCSVSDSPEQPLLR